MPNIHALRPGYSRKIIEHNYAQLMREGHMRNAAISAAISFARASYFHRYPKGILPTRLAYPKDKRTAEYYDSLGKPVSRNPVSQLPISAKQRAQIKRDASKNVAGQSAEVKKAARLFSDFTGYDDPQLTRLKVEKSSSVLLQIGHVDGILYTTSRDGRTEKYIHRFKKSSRPLLLASSDGNTLQMRGGAFKFTERGIVDK